MHAIGYRIFCERDLVLAALADGEVGRDIALMSVGGSQPGTLPGGYCYALGEVNNERLMSFAYSAADLFVLPNTRGQLAQHRFGGDGLPDPEYCRSCGNS
jgi:hypothetical protein